MGKIKDLSGQVFGRLTVLGFSHVERNLARWICRCECGKELIMRGASLRNGESKSCGCLRIDRTVEVLTTHGHTAGRRTPEYAVWSGMIGRCRNEKHISYPRYGGRGIDVCEEWLRFENFIRDMGPRPSDKHSIDRRDNSLGYSKENCFWATPLEQSRNKRSNRRIDTPLGPMLLCEAAEKSGIDVQCLMGRIARGWMVADLFKTPLVTRKKAKEV